MNSIPNPNPVISITLMFALTQVLGLAAGILLIGSSATDENFELLSISPVKDSSSMLNSVLLIFYVLLGAGFALLIIKYLRTKIVFRFMELAVVGGSVSVFAFAFIYAFCGMDFFTSMAVSIILGGSFALLKFFVPGLKNMAAILSSAGVAAIFGYSVGFIPALVFVIALSLYDFWAVFKTKHMLALAQGLGSGDLSFTITAKSGAKTAVVPKKAEKESGVQKTGADESENNVARLDLGSGDLAIPAMLAVSTYPVAGLIGSLAIMIGAIISIYATLQFVIKKQVVLPALPPICIGSLIMLFISQAIMLALGIQ
ncbi:MAG: presenilin family intramembrane aspartyl protease [Candidatus Micrarchaeia archaeon]